MASEHQTKIFYPASKAQWRLWLEKNHLKEQCVWIVFYNKNSLKKSITWSDAVEVALCFGWIDSKKIKIDNETSHQFFCKRKLKSTWSKINKEKVQILTEAGLMTPAGLKSIEIAKNNGSWTILDEVEELIIPPDLDAAFKKHKGARESFTNLSKSTKKMKLTSLVLAKRSETRQQRIDEILNSILQKK